MSKLKTALILGGAESVFADADRAMEMFTPDAVIAVNDMIAAWPGKITHACTLHGEKLLAWQDARKEAGFNRNYKTVYFEKPASIEGEQPRIDRQIDYRWPHTGDGSSGLYAVKIALDLGCEKVVLAGVPMSAGSGHFVRHEPWNACNGLRAAWVSAIPRILGKVKSTGGWTAEILGHPTAKWLAG